MKAFCHIVGISTAAMYSLEAAEQRLGELSHGKDVFIATKFPGMFSFKESVILILFNILAKIIKIFCRKIG